MSAVADRVGTGASLGEYDRLWTYLHRDKHTTCRVEGLNNPGLHQTLRKFDYSINDPLLPLLYFAGVEAFEALNAGAGNVTFDFIRRLTHTAEGADEVAAQTSSAEQTGRRRGSQQVLSVIAECAAVLDLPEPDVAQAAGIARSSYFNWKSKPQTRPQLAKVSKLWLLAQAVTNLEDVTEGRAAHWLHADPSRRERVLAGDFEAVFDEAWREHLDDDMSTAGAQARAERQRTAAPAYAAGFAVGSDTAAEGASSGTTVRRGTVRSARRRPRSAEPDPRTSP